MSIQNWFKNNIKSQQKSNAINQQRLKKYKCTVCGKEHSEWPALAYSSPDKYAGLSEKEQNSLATIDEDFCIINYTDQTDRFIRAVMFQKVINHDVDLHYGLWVSLSEKSFKDYLDNFKNPNHETSYFGWLCNAIPEYEFEESVPTTVWTKTGNSRPEIIPHKDFDHPFVRDYYFGISKEDAETRIHKMIKNVG